ncbi:MAG: YggS family pyridoxal phosphate-dependent enzyme [Nanoarchaeota archaeon]|nr:YggS family pyridoxal phosphate-dependent enzyme [Nanoarchaeota archaeon]
MIEENLEKIFAQINSKDVHLVAVSKRKPITDIKKAIISGIRNIGENRVQEAFDKYTELKDFLDQNKVKLHLIGHLQTNKAKKAVEIADLIHSVDSLKIANEINKKAAAIEKVQSILIQINIGKEEQKSGCKPDDLPALLKAISGLKNLKIKGLMCITPYFDDPEKTRPYFRKMRALFENIRQSDMPNVEMKYLSMGMTHDYLVAMEEGANMIRIGTGIFGERE